MAAAGVCLPARLASCLRGLYEASTAIRTYVPPDCLAGRSGRAWEPRRFWKQYLAPPHGGGRLYANDPEPPGASDCRRMGRPTGEASRSSTKPRGLPSQGIKEKETGPGSQSKTLCLPLQVFEGVGLLVPQEATYYQEDQPPQLGEDHQILKKPEPLNLGAVDPWKNLPVSGRSSRPPEA